MLSPPHFEPLGTARRDKSLAEELPEMSQSVLDELPLRIYWKDPNGVYLGCNQAVVNDAGLNDVADLIGKTDFDLPWGAEHAASYRREDLNIMYSGKPKTNFEEEQRLTDGTVRHLETTKKPLYSKAGELVGVLGITQFITERSQAEIAIRKARDEAEVANRMKSEFISTMSHEIRSPMNVILGHIDLLNIQEQDPARKETLKTLTTSGQRLRDLIDDVFDIGRIESENVILKKNAFDPAIAFTRYFDAMASLAEERGIQYTLEIGDSVPSTVISDGSRWGQIVRNLLSNAIKFTPEGSVKVKLSATPTDDINSGVRLHVIVSDTGIGMSRDTASQVFNKFYRGDSSIGRKYPGTGLGLCISRKLARLLGGDITVATSQENSGSTFVATITCPAAPTVSSSNLTPSNLDPDAIPLPELEIVAVDDLPSNLILVKAFLKQIGLPCRTFPDAATALSHIEQHNVDVILMDIEMPVTNGLKLTHQIREQKHRSAALGREIHIIAMTAGVLPEERQRCFDAGMNDYLSKPFNLAELRAVLAKISG